jgi:carboxypeptidase C (cathepsin A)
MYLSGFGYAGIIAPKLALNIIEHNRNPDTAHWLRLNLNGLLLFNPCTMPEECDRHFQFNHFTVRALRDHFFISPETYEEYYSKCAMRTSACTEIEERIASDFRITGADLGNLYTECLNQKGDYGCIDHMGIDIFLNVYAVKEDIHANKDIKWDLCNFTLAQNY